MTKFNIHKKLIVPGFVKIPVLPYAVLVLILLLQSFCSFGQTGQGNEPKKTAAIALSNVEETVVTLVVPRLGSIELAALISNEQVYLSVNELFDFLKIKHTPSAGYDSLSGYINNPQSGFIFDLQNQRITYQGKIFDFTHHELVKRGINFYLALDEWGRLFGLDCVFDPYGLTAVLNSKIEFPALRELQFNMARNGVQKQAIEQKADTVIRRNASFFRLGMADWSAVSTQASGQHANNRFVLRMGALLAGGELSATFNYDSRSDLKTRDQYYQWRYVKNDSRMLKRITAGKLFAQSVSSILRPITGIQLSNTPTGFRQSYGTYKISNTTTPGWLVELYLNNVLIDYTKADETGLYTFEVPMQYGSSQVKLRFYGPYGESKNSEHFISIPFNFMPPKQLEYAATAGVVHDDEKSRFARVNLNYGLNHHFTIGGGIEYLSSVSTGKPMPFMNASARVLKSVLISADYMQGVRSKWVLNYRRPKGFQLDMSYTHYNRNQTAIKYFNAEEKKMVLSIPLSNKKISTFSRLTLSQFEMPENRYLQQKINARYTTAEWLMAVVTNGISANISSNVMLVNNSSREITSGLSFTFRPAKSIRITPQVQYRYSVQKISMLKLEAEKSFYTRGSLIVAYERIYKTRYTGSLIVGLRYNFSFAQMFSSVSKGRNGSYSTQSAHGSLLYESRNRRLYTENQNNTGTAGLLIIPFLDLNANGKKDKDEPKVAGLKLQIAGGKIMYDRKDSCIRITGLEAYKDYLLDFDNSGFDNISWQLPKKLWRIRALPNNFNQVLVPVSVSAEIAGKVYIADSVGKSGIGRIRINIYNSNQVLVAQVLSEADGFFNYFGLKPGSYTITVDGEQQKNLKLSADFLKVNILPSITGVYISGLDITLFPSDASVSPVFY